MLSKMQVIDLKDEYLPLYLVCLEDWSEEMKESGNRKEIWYNKMKDKGLRVKLALDDSGEVGGMIQYNPIEHSFIEGDDLYFINCIWVHGYEEGRGNFQNKGMGSALLKAAEDDAKELGVKGIAAWGISQPFWMNAPWFEKHGYRRVDDRDMSILLWKPFTEDATPPKWIRAKKKPETTPGKVTVTVFISGWCPAQNIVYERAKRAAAEFGDDVIFQEFDSSVRDVLQEWGISEALFIDDEHIETGPPPPYEEIRKKIEEKVKRL